MEQVKSILGGVNWPTVAVAVVLVLVVLAVMRR